jgi:hypothetical protein
MSKAQPEGQHFSAADKGSGKLDFSPEAELPFVQAHARAPPKRFVIPKRSEGSAFYAVTTRSIAKKIQTTRTFENRKTAPPAT